MAKKSGKRGGARKGSGRKPKGDRAFDAALIVKCDSAERDHWSATAKDRKTTLAEVVRAYLRRWARPKD